MTLPLYESQRALDMAWAFSTKKQVDYDTPIPDADIDKSHSLREISVAEITKEARSDRDSYGKGHEFATTFREVARDLRISRSFDGSSLILGWLFAFGLGKIVTIQPDSTGSPNTYLHTMTFFDPSVENTAQLPVTSIIEKVSGAAALKRLLPSLALASLTVSGEGFEHLVAAADFIGSGAASASTKVMPGLTAVSFLASNYAIVKLGDTEEDITTRVRSWSVALNNDPREARGYFPSSGLYRGRMEIGKRSIVPSLVVDLAEDSDLYDDFLSHTELALDMYCEGDVVEEGKPYKHYLRIRFPNLYYSALPIESADDILTYGITFNEESVLYNAAATPNPVVTVEVQNGEQSYLTEPTP